MKNSHAEKGLIFDEPLLWEKGQVGRCGFSIPRRDVDSKPLDKDLTREGLDFPDLNELDIVRHYTRLSQWNFGVDTGLYPLGSCTMKYNPKINETLSRIPGIANLHPLQPEKLSQAASIISKYPVAIQLRFLQTLSEVSAENNSTTIFPVPIDLFKPFIEKYVSEKGK